MDVTQVVYGYGKIITMPLVISAGMLWILAHEVLRQKSLLMMFTTNVIFVWFLAEIFGILSQNYGQNEYPQKLTVILLCLAAASLASCIYDAFQRILK